MDGENGFRPENGRDNENPEALFSDLLPFADQSISSMENALYRLKLTQGKGELTEIGKETAELRKALNVSTRGARLIVEAKTMEREDEAGERALLFPSLVLASYREDPDIFFWPDYEEYSDLLNTAHVEKRAAARAGSKEKRSEIYKGKSDLELALHLFATMLKEVDVKSGEDAALTTWCKQYDLNPQAMFEWLERTRGYTKELKIPFDTQKQIQELQAIDSHTIARLTLAAHKDQLMLMKAYVEEHKHKQDRWGNSPIWGGPSQSDQEEQERKKREEYERRLPVYIFPGDLSGFPWNQRNHRKEVMMSPFSLSWNDRNTTLCVPLGFREGRGTRGREEIRRFYAQGIHPLTLDDLKPVFDNFELRVESRLGLHYDEKKDRWTNTARATIDGELLAEGSAPVDPEQARDELAGKLLRSFNRLTRRGSELDSILGGNYDKWVYYFNINSRSHGKLGRLVPEIEELMNIESWYKKKLDEWQAMTVKEITPHAKELEFPEPGIPAGLLFILEHEYPVEVQIKGQPYKIDYEHGRPSVFIPYEIVLKLEPDEIPKLGAPDDQTSLEIGSKRPDYPFPLRNQDLNALKVDLQKPEHLLR